MLDCRLNFVPFYFFAATYDCFSFDQIAQARANAGDVAQSRLGTRNTAEFRFYRPACCAKLFARQATEPVRTDEACQRALEFGGGGTGYACPVADREYVGLRAAHVAVADRAPTTLKRVEFNVTASELRQVVARLQAIADAQCVSFDALDSA